jgi:hypothetical protein
MVLKEIKTELKEIKTEVQNLKRRLDNSPSAPLPKVPRIDEISSKLNVIQKIKIPVPVATISRFQPENFLDTIKFDFFQDLQSFDKKLRSSKENERKYVS